LNLTGLGAWCDVTGFTGQHQNPTPNNVASGTLAVSFQERATPFYDVGAGRTLRFLSEYAGPRRFDNAKQVILKERNTIELGLRNPVSIKHLLQELHIWQSFLTFALRRPCYTDELYLLRRGEQRVDRFGLILPGRKIPPADRRAGRDAVFRETTLGNRIEERLRGWRQQYEHIDLAILIFCGAVYQDSVHIHTNLLSYLQALEVLHRELYAGDRFPDPQTRRDTIAALRNALPQSLDPALQQELSDSVGFIGAVTLLDRLKQLFALYRKSLGPLFRRGDADMATLKDVRNFLTHYGEQKARGKDFLWSREVLVLKEKARLFMVICLLGAMGMSDDEIEELMSRFEPYNGWRMEATIELVNEGLRGAEAKVAKAKRVKRRPATRPKRQA
jgi:hypothetical protein